MLTREAMLAAVQRRTVTEPSAVFGGDVRVQELTRAEFRAAQVAAAGLSPNEWFALNRLRQGVHAWSVGVEIDADARMELLGVLTQSNDTNADVWNAHIFAASVVDDTGKALFTPADVLAFPERDDVWDEVIRLDTIALNLSEVRPDALKAPSTDSPETTE